MTYQFPILVNGEWIETNEKHELFSPFDGRAVGTTYRAGPQEIERAIVSAQKAFKETRVLPLYHRSENLRQIAQGIHDSKEEFAQIMCAEAGKPIKIARQEVDRAIFTFTDAAEECKRIRGEYLPLDLDPGSKNRWALIKRFPVGPILGISPFNFPLNLVCHKVAPALAAGNPIILKPSSATPLTALRLGQEVMKTAWPSGAFNILPMNSKNAHLLVADERLKMLTFTGSPVIGWNLKKQAGHKPVTLELGGNAAVIIHHDADLDFASTRCTMGGFTYSGQNCISVQRIYLHDTIYDKFMDLFLKKVRALKSGNPADETVDVGPMINQNEITRISEWIQEAVDDSAKILAGGSASGRIFEPTVLSSVKPEMQVSCREVFAPLVVVYRYSEIDEALNEVNNSEYGLQAGIMTRDAGIIFRAFETLEVGGVIAGDVPTYRIDHMPYGGIKQSGLGREGVRFAIEEMTEPKLLVMNM